LSVNRRWIAGTFAAIALGVGAFSPAISIHADSDPKDVLRTAVDSTRQVTSLHAEAHTTGSNPAPSGTDVHWSASLAGTDSDISVQNSTRSVRTIAIGSKVYQQTPLGPGATWQVQDRGPVVDDTTPGMGLLALTFPDGRSAGMRSLYTSVTSSTSTPPAAAPVPTIGNVQLGTVASAQTTTPQQQTLIGQLNMQQVGLALRAGASDLAVINQWQGTLTVTVGSDGRIVHQVLALHGPSPTAGEPPFSLTHDVSYSQFNATSVSAPVQP